MSFSDWNTLAQTIIQGIALVGGSLTVLIGWLQFRRFRRERVQRVEDKLNEVLTRGLGGEYIVGMSEQAGQQLRQNVRRILEEEL
jgi:hypothetical protein